ncbi:MAG: helix-turn-helix transcriptional regulator [Candidatus Pelethousia sp.]|nr:helix-turn-helix transcriptional regulator [Candidatus Pelethousia sp.]
MFFAPFLFLIPLACAESLAQTFHVSPSYLHKIFRKQLNTSPIQYISNIKINEAQYLLSTSDLSIIQIAERCGFGDSRYFSRVFKSAPAFPPRNTGQRPVTRAVRQDAE